ncbi:unnamed protein product [Rotaria magnacalcarata]|uniref:Uncharacterized protein n=1 Tax=Rotaria magnacalcarata TaxID=392030 RepID=A0A814MES1_9BILA|nr:unnamed protein product [Rotaria magnacalcarata]CAF1344092.1 unnamed protein product [Rotaria magnacalcarata]CAF2155864.1 unnamed protein product [Rotaria magnacalcarata]CAF2183682.1 unnamed protein product [Rotaria magnacalcarata]CAF4074696.1 unnamed protein product [Rotaria magnacalcarata]
MTTLTTFQDLCIDIVVEILSYFNVHELFYSFCLLIPCLPKLLVNGRVRLHVRSNNSYFIRWILPHIQLAQVYSLNVPTRPYNPSIFEFTGLRSLVLHDVDNPLLLFESSNNWPLYYLEHLSLHIRNQDIPSTSSNTGTRVLERAFQLRRLKHFELHESKSSLKMVEMYDQLIFPSTFKSSPIKCLIITVYCNWTTLQSMLNYLPDLQHFRFRSSLRYFETRSPQFCFSLIRKLNLRLDGLQTENFVSLFRSAPVLRQLRLQCSFTHFKQCQINLLKSDSWIQVMNTYTPQLKVLQIDLKFRLNNIDEKTIETINDDLKILNFKINVDSDNGNHCWQMAGVFRRFYSKEIFN